MTQRTEGLVTYTEETRVTKARIPLTAGDWNKHIDVELINNGERIQFLFRGKNPTLEHHYARALLDAITVMLGDEEPRQAVGDAIIARLIGAGGITHTPAPNQDYRDGRNVGVQWAAAIVRDQCGLPE